MLERAFFVDQITLQNFLLNSRLATFSLSQQVFLVQFCFRYLLQRVGFVVRLRKKLFKVNAIIEANTMTEMVQSGFSFTVLYVGVCSFIFKKHCHAGHTTFSCCFYERC